MLTAITEDKEEAAAASPRVRPRDRHSNYESYKKIDLRYYFGLLKMYLFKRRLKLRARYKLRLIHDELEATSAESTVVLRRIVNGDFLVGFQGCLSANDMKQHISEQCCVTLDRITLVANAEILDGGRLWNYKRLMRLSQDPVIAGFTLAQQSTFDIRVAIHEDVQHDKSQGYELKGICLSNFSGKLPFNTDWPGDPRM